MKKAAYGQLPVINDKLIDRINDAATLAERYLAVTDNSMGDSMELSDLDHEQEHILKALAGDENGSKYVFHQPSSPAGTHAYIHAINRTLLNAIVDGVNHEFGTTFAVGFSEDLVKEFDVTGFDMDVMFSMIDKYFANRTPEQIVYFDALHKFYTRVARALSLRTGMDNEPQKSVQIKDFISTYVWDENTVFDNDDSILRLIKYYEIVLGEKIFADGEQMNLRHDNIYKPKTELKSPVKSIRAFKNRKITITFHDQSGYQQFTAPLVEYAKSKFG